MIANPFIKNRIQPMKLLFAQILILIALLLASCIKKQAEVNIIPKPLEQKIGNEAFTYNAETKIIIGINQNLETLGAYLVTQLSNINLKSEVQYLEDINSTENAFIIQLDRRLDDFDDEGYLLSVDRKKILLEAKTIKGLVWGIQSFLQLIPVKFFEEENHMESFSVPEVYIKDKPRFSYRGMHLDVCRHMFSVDFIKKYLDIMAYYKFNTFHWHLTEDQGWRIEIKKYPKLMSVAAYRDSTLIGHYRDQPHTFDGERYGGYYTQEEIKEIVQYASERNITIIPEIEMPGHSVAALAAYPELACTDGPFRTATTWGVFEDVYCPKENTFVFLEDVLSEVIDMFPGKYIHIGGDEVPKTNWKNCSDCQQLIQSESLENEDGLQSYFIKRIEKFLNSKGRQLIGWDEILEGGLSPNATVMSWRGIEGGIEAAKFGHDAIMTPGSYCYFDHYQANPNFQPLAIGGFTPLKKVYEYDPIPDKLAEGASKHILGAQANVWTEYITTPEQIEYMILPRMAALSEVNWTGRDKKDWADFQKRINAHFNVYEALGYNYCKGSYALEFMLDESDQNKIEIRSEIYRPEIRYTTDGSIPTNASKIYKKPIKAIDIDVIKAAIFVEGEMMEEPGEFIIKK
ncbi:MAG: beta-N-acetylhexosaminidase [Marinilabiliales bacterium]|nr:MAG: beta-N-acetylhexosaminidase [Marinilabiliales bacterium]